MASRMLDVLGMRALGNLQRAYGTASSGGERGGHPGGVGGGPPAGVGGDQGRLGIQLKADVDEGGGRLLCGRALGEAEAVPAAPLLPLLLLPLVELVLRLQGEAVILLLLFLLCRNTAEAVGKEVRGDVTNAL